MQTALKSSHIKLCEARDKPYSLNHLEYKLNYSQLSTFKLLIRVPLAEFYSLG